MEFDTPTEMPALPDRLTEKELARHWRITPRTLQRWRENGDGPPWLKIGGRVLYPRGDMLAFEAGHKTAGGAE